MYIFILYTGSIRKEYQKFAFIGRRWAEWPDSECYAIFFSTQKPDLKNSLFVKIDNIYSV